MTIEEIKNLPLELLTSEEFMHFIMKDYAKDFDKTSALVNDVANFVIINYGEDYGAIIIERMRSFIQCTDTYDHAAEDHNRVSKLPQIENFLLMTQNPPELKPELICGILRQGHKMIFTGGSKVGKSFLLIELALSIACGCDWLGFKCETGRVLYVNMEIDSASFYHRVEKIIDRYTKQKLGAKNLDIWNLRGCGQTMETLKNELVRRCANRDYQCVVLDPVYKVVTGDENSAHDMAILCGYFDEICTDLGVSFIYAHHHSKGAQGFKNAIDRGSGSGVFARDADAIIDLTELDTEAIGVKLPTDVTAFRVQGTLREFRSFIPFEIKFEYPVHVLCDGLENAPARSGSRSGADAGSRANQLNVPQRKDLHDNTIIDKVNEWYEFYHRYPSVLELAGQIGKTDRTVRGWINDSEKVHITDGKVMISGSENSVEKD